LDAANARMLEVGLGEAGGRFICFLSRRDSMI
jgi:hypothetical protein